MEVSTWFQKILRFFYLSFSLFPFISFLSYILLCTHFHFVFFSSKSIITFLPFSLHFDTSNSSSLQCFAHYLYFSVLSLYLRSFFSSSLFCSYFSSPLLILIISPICHLSSSLPLLSLASLFLLFSSLLFTFSTLFLLSFFSLLFSLCSI